MDLSPLASMLASPRPGVRGNAALVLGMIGDPSAIPMMQEMTQAPMRRATAAEQALAHLQVAEAMVTLGEEGALDAIRAGAYSSHDEVRVLAVQTMGRIQDRRMIPGLRPFLEQNPIELRLAAAESLARMGVAEGLDVLVKGAASNIPTARAQSAFGLALIDDPRAADALVTLLDDPMEQVRLSAAAAVIRALEGRGYRS